MTRILFVSPYYRLKLGLLLVLSFVFRSFLAFWLELGNDEVYYYTYALFPDLSHFDHPPMIGWAMQLFSLNLRFDNELALRFSSVVFMTINTFLIFQMGKILRSERSGWFAALLYTSSIYAFIITGVFILPDAPQSFFWMLSLWLMLLAVKEGQNEGQLRLLFPLIGLSIGLAMISKYTSVFLWFGFGLYILLFRRHWLSKPSLYLSILISALCLTPVLLWNIQNNFISFSFHGQRVNIFEGGIRPSTFLTEIAGEILYNNPVVFVLVWIGVATALRQNKTEKSAGTRLLLLIGLPLIGLFLFFSLFRATLPHWTGPAYNTLLLLAATALDNGRRNLFPKPIIVALSLILIVAVAGSAQIKFALIPMNDKQPYQHLGKNDVTLDMFGWRALEPRFKEIRAEKIKQGLMQPQDGILGDNWFPLANLDYYIGRPLSIKSFGMGSPERLHKYVWINVLRGGFHEGDNFWYITNSRDYKNPAELYFDDFDQIIPADTIEISRSGKPAKRYFVFLLKGLKRLPPNYLDSLAP